MIILWFLQRCLCTNEWQKIASYVLITSVNYLRYKSKLSLTKKKDWHRSWLTMKHIKILIFWNRTWPTAYPSTSNFLIRWGPCFVFQSSLCTVNNSDTMASLSEMLPTVKHFSTVKEPDDCNESSPKCPRSLQRMQQKTQLKNVLIA